MPKITVTLWCTPAVLDRLIGVDDALGVQRTNRPPKPAWEMPYPILTTWRRKAQGVREGNLLPPKKWRDLKNPWVEMLRMEWQSRDLIAQPILPTMHYGLEQPDNGTSNHSLFRQLGSERVSQRANEWAGQICEQSRASQWVSNVTNEQMGVARYLCPNLLMFCTITRWSWGNCPSNFIKQRLSLIALLFAYPYSHPSINLFSHTYLLVCLEIFD